MNKEKYEQANKKVALRLCKRNNMDSYKKKYEEALEKAKDMLAYKEVRKEDMEHLFPELKESENEDEKIRKSIVSGMKALQEKGKYTCFANVPMDDVFAWLEKQGDKDKLIKELGEYKVKYTQEVLEKHINSMGNKDDERLRKTTIAFLKDFADKGYENAVECIDWLKRQGEPLNESVYDTEDKEMYQAISIGLTDAFEEYGWSDFGGIPIENIQNWLEKQGEKLVKDIESDKAEKFKVGDWIVNKGHSYLIADIDYEQRRYLFEIGGYTHEQLNWEYIENADNKYHLWTLADAKDGDVLAFDNDTIVIFKDLYNATTFHSYCHIEDGIFAISEEDMPDWWEGKGFVPATKEQCSILFAKMKEAGYVWDAERKELKKIENEIEIPFGAKDSELQEATYFIPKGFHAEIDDDKVVIKKGEQKPTDEEMKELLQTEYEKGRADAIAEMHKGWTEEDEGYYNSIIEHLKYSITNGKSETYRSGRLTDWLKSLKEKYTLYTWKPSVKQMNALDSTLQYSKVSHDSYEHLNSLYNDLTKLTPIQ